MRKALLLFTFAACLIPSFAASGQAPGRSPLRDVLPADGLDEKSVLVFHDQAALNVHYYLADETVLGLDKTTEAVFARYRTGPREALLLVVSYPSEGKARLVYEKFGADFFSNRFDRKAPRTTERLETGDYAAAVRTGSFLIIVLEAPDKKSCDDLARRVEERAVAFR